MSTLIGPYAEQPWVVEGMKQWALKREKCNAGYRSMSGEITWRGRYGLNMMELFTFGS